MPEEEKPTEEKETPEEEKPIIPLEDYVPPIEEKVSIQHKHKGTDSPRISHNDLLDNPTVPDEFTDLDDTPSSLSGQGDKYVKVNSGATALEFLAFPGLTDGWDLVNSEVFTADKVISSLDGVTDGLYCLIIRARNSADFYIGLKHNNSDVANSWLCYHYGGYNTGAANHGVNESTVVFIDICQDLGVVIYAVVYISCESGVATHLKWSSFTRSDNNNWMNLQGGGFWNTTNNLTSLGIDLSVASITAGKYWLYKPKT